ncbi:hypothetical protein B0E43_22540 [Algoriphagus sp. A40]|nr:hypothetical protein B0E43_22540 [Algoriphagus sp. A40]
MKSWIENPILGLRDYKSRRAEIRIEMGNSDGAGSSFEKRGQSPAQWKRNVHWESKEDSLENGIANSINNGLGL